MLTSVPIIPLPPESSSSPHFCKSQSRSMVKFSLRLIHGHSTPHEALQDKGWPHQACAPHWHQQLRRSARLPVPPCSLALRPTRKPSATSLSVSLPPRYLHSARSNTISAKYGYASQETITMLVKESTKGDLVPIMANIVRGLCPPCILNANVRDQPDLYDIWKLVRKMEEDDGLTNASGSPCLCLDIAPPHTRHPADPTPSCSVFSPRVYGSRVMLRSGCQDRKRDI